MHALTKLQKMTYVVAPPGTLIMLFPFPNSLLSSLAQFPKDAFARTHEKRLQQRREGKENDSKKKRGKKCNAQLCVFSTKSKRSGFLGMQMHMHVNKLLQSAGETLIYGANLSS